jgi:hypothetical protein
MQPSDEKAGITFDWDHLVAWATNAFRFDSQLRTETKSIDLMIDDLEMLELVAPSTDAARKFLNLCMSRMYATAPANITSLHSSDTRVRNITVYGRQASDSPVDMRAVSLNLGHALVSQAASADAFSSSPLRISPVDGKPALSEYLLHRYCSSRFCDVLAVLMRVD